VNPVKAKRVLKESLRRSKNLISWDSSNFKTQNNFVNDPSPFKAAQTTRRAGKSFSAGKMLFKAALKHPGCSVLYITKTRDMANRIMFQPILGEINRVNNIGATPNRTSLTYTLPNGSIIYLLGIDNSPEEADKLLGQKFAIVVIDEAAFISRDLENIIYEHLKPAVADYNGQIVMISTTSDMVGCFFYKVTEEGYLGWKVHKWTAYDNPFMAEKWDKEIKQLKKMNPTIDETPRFRRMYLNQWVVSEDAKVYKANRDRNVIDKYDSNKRLTYVLGLDLGWEDATAFTITGYDSSTGLLYIIETFKRSKMTLTQVAERVKAYEKKYNLETIVVDNASKQSVEDMRARYDINFTPAIKVNKKEYIEIMNDQFILNKIKILASNEDLLEEYSNLVWNEKLLSRGKYKEHDACDNHLCDSTLYAWRYSYTYLKDIQPEPVVTPTSEAAVDQFWEREEQLIDFKQSEDYDWLEG
jgi:PBSX family phage terminase large subunit